MNNCPICKLWEMMPYHKRWSTPMTPGEGEGALAAGWWAALNSQFSGTLCDRHQTVMKLFDDQHAERIRVENELRVQVVPTHVAQVQDYLARAVALTAKPPTPEPVKPLPVVPHLGGAPPPAPLPIPEPKAPFVMTAPPPVAAIMSGIQSQPQPVAAAAILATAFPCPTCGKEITSGQVHVCVTEEEKPKEEKLVTAKEV